MSKQSEAKIRQNYVAKLVPNTCGNCANLTQDFYHYDNQWRRVDGKNPDTSEGANSNHSENLRCGIGCFAVKKMGSCTEWRGK